LKILDIPAENGSVKDSLTGKKRAMMYIPSALHWVMEVIGYEDQTEHADAETMANLILSTQ